MAMRTHGVETKGMILTINELQNLMKLNKENIEQKFELEDIDNIEFEDILDFTYNINFATFIGEFNGYLDIDKTQERMYFGDRYYGSEDIILFELMKNNLYEKYNNREEIIQELKDDLKAVGIIVDNNYVERHFGYICGSYVA